MSSRSVWRSTSPARAVALPGEVHVPLDEAAHDANHESLSARTKRREQIAKGGGVGGGVGVGGRGGGLTDLMADG